jgi:hypothetical protein
MTLDFYAQDGVRIVAVEEDIIRNLHIVFTVTEIDASLSYYYAFINFASIVGNRLESAEVIASNNHSDLPNIDRATTLTLAEQIRSDDGKTSHRYEQAFLPARLKAHNKAQQGGDRNHEYAGMVGYSE